MSEPGGVATQAGIYYQNSVAAFMLANLLDFDPHLAHERVVEVRVEAPEYVDDLVVRYADDHRKFLNVKLSVTRGSSAWRQIWLNLNEQKNSPDFGNFDRFVIVVCDQSADSLALAELSERVKYSLDEPELRSRINLIQASVIDSIIGILESSEAVLGLLKLTSVMHLSEAQIQSELARRTLSGGQAPSLNLLSDLRDIAACGARRRGLFHAAPLRRKLKLERGIELAEPPEWGLGSYRSMIARLSRIEIPGMGISGTTDELFVWPRARERDLARRADFEDERARLTESIELSSIDLSSFPSEQFERIIVVAGPGYGKSALLTTIAGRLAAGPFVPVLLPLASFAASNASIMDFLGSYISREMDLRADWQRLAEQGLLVLLLDGLDEVPTRERPLLMRRISTFSARYSRTPWILTVRDAAVVTGLSEAKVVELLPLNDEDILRFVNAMKRYVGKGDGWRVVQRLKLYPDLDRLARIPLFLAMLLATTNLRKSEPITRSDLIESYLKTLFSPATHKPHLDLVDRSVALRAIAETIAFERLEQQEIGATEHQVREVIGRIATSSEEARILFELLPANGILKQQSAVRLQFPYPIVQEYLAAQHLVARHPESIEKRIEDAVQRPWAQVIQFALELHPSPAAIIRDMLGRADDAFCTGLRLVGRCIANGALVDDPLRLEVGDRLVQYWIHAPSNSRERVGRLLIDGFSSTPTSSLRVAVHHYWLMSDGAGEIVSKVNDTHLTLSVLDTLMQRDHSSFMIYHDLKPALNAAGDSALRAIITKMDPDTHDEEKLISLSSLLSNFSPASVSQELVLSIARNSRLPSQARMRAFELAGLPLDEESKGLVLAGLKSKDWDRHYVANSLVSLDPNPAQFIGALLRDDSISLERRKDIAIHVIDVLPISESRRSFFDSSMKDDELHEELRLILMIVEARFGDRETFERLLDGVGRNAVQYAAISISLFGHFPDRDLAERAAATTRQRDFSPDEVVRMANSVTTGMLFIFEMDIGFGGTLIHTAPHPGIAAWIELMDDWADRPDLSPRNRLDILSAGAQLGSDRARSRLEIELLAIENMNSPIWLGGDNNGHTLSSALREYRQRVPVLPRAFLEKILESTKYNIAAQGVAALEAAGDHTALLQLIDFHRAATEYHMRDMAANTLELMAAKQGLTLSKNSDGGYFVCDSLQE